LIGVVLYDVAGGDVMHRTQVILEDKQYQFLKKVSEKEKKSISQLLREIVNKYSEKSDVFSVSSIAGIAEDKEIYGKDHDKWLYRKK
jgi:predicted DNA-binding ribbon-helix-helix protein|tara:strand:- start:1773 stop:2033 length:261 start_codon:yes stop_codon:yes gene_type:complete